MCETWKRLLFLIPLSCLAFIFFRVLLTLCQHLSCIKGEQTKLTPTENYIHFWHWYRYFQFVHVLPNLSIFVSLFFPSEPAMPGIWHSLLTRPWLLTGSWLNTTAWKRSSSRKFHSLLQLRALLCASLLHPTPSWPDVGSEAASPREAPSLLQSFASSWPLWWSWETVPELHQLWPPTFR